MHSPLLQPAWAPLCKLLRLIKPIPEPVIKGLSIWGLSSNLTNGAWQGCRGEGRPSAWFPAAGRMGPGGGGQGREWSSHGR